MSCPGVFLRVLATPARPIPPCSTPPLSQPPFSVGLSIPLLSFLFSLLLEPAAARAGTTRAISTTAAASTSTSTPRGCHRHHRSLLRLERVTFSSTTHRHSYRDREGSTPAQAVAGLRGVLLSRCGGRQQPPSIVVHLLSLQRNTSLLASLMFFCSGYCLYRTADAAAARFFGCCCYG